METLWLGKTNCCLIIHNEVRKQFSTTQEALIPWGIRMLSGLHSLEEWKQPRGLGVRITYFWKIEEYLWTKWNRRKWKSQGRKETTVSLRIRPGKQLGHLNNRENSIQEIVWSTGWRGRSSKQGGWATAESDGKWKRCTGQPCGRGSRNHSRSPRGTLGSRWCCRRAGGKHRLSSVRGKVPRPPTLDPRWSKAPGGGWLGALDSEQRAQGEGPAQEGRPSGGVCPASGPPSPGPQGPGSGILTEVWFGFLGSLGKAAGVSYQPVGRGAVREEETALQTHFQSDWESQKKASWRTGRGDRDELPRQGTGWASHADGNLPGSDSLAKGHLGDRWKPH